MKKRILTFLMAAAMCISMTACSTVDEADTGAAGGTAVEIACVKSAVRITVPARKD